jgi:hypothetical protein
MSKDTFEMNRRTVFAPGMTFGALALLSACTSTNPGGPVQDGGALGPDAATDSGGIADSGGAADASTDAGGDASAPGTITGMIGGQTPSVTEATALLMTRQEPMGEVYAASVGLMNYSGACALYQQYSSWSKANATTISVIVYSKSPITPGTFAVAPDGGTSEGFVSFDSTDGQCADSFESATSGSVTFSAVSATSISGTFTAIFANGSLQGSFSAPVCNASPPDAGATDGGMTCLP